MLCFDRKNVVILLFAVSCCGCGTFMKGGRSPNDLEVILSENMSAELGDSGNSGSVPSESVLELDALLPPKVCSEIKNVEESSGDLSESGAESEDVLITSEDNGVEDYVADVAVAEYLPIIAPGMLLDVSIAVNGKDEINREKCNVSQEGDVYLPLLKKVNIVGLTIVDAESKLTELCGKYFVNPQVDISFSRGGQDDFISPWGYVTVMGNVITPGRIALSQGRNLRLSEAVARAGGLAPSAKDKAVVLTRRMSDGEVVKQKINLRSIVAGGKIDEDVKLSPGDCVFVPETMF